MLMGGSVIWNSILCEVHNGCFLGRPFRGVEEKKMRPLDWGGGEGLSVASG